MNKPVSLRTHNEQALLLQRFYLAFKQRDAETMIGCYHREAQFSDPVFNDLRCEDIHAMWRMLCQRAEQFKLDFEVLAANRYTGRVAWTAQYLFNKTGRPVINHVHSYLVFKDGLIFQQRDKFNFWHWAGMALGAKGWLLGWTPLLKKAVREQAVLGLQKFLEENHALR